MRTKMIDANKLLKKINDIEEPKGLLGSFVHAAKVWAEALVTEEPLVDWIPLSPETMPEDEAHVLLTIAAYDGHEYVQAAIYDELRGLFIIEEAGVHLSNADYLLGWMPAPEPMKMRNK